MNDGGSSSFATGYRRSGAGVPVLHANTSCCINGADWFEISDLIN